MLSLIPLWTLYAALPGDFAQHSLDPYQLMGGPASAMHPFALGLLLPLFIIVALWLWWVRHREGEIVAPITAPLLRFSAVTIALALFLSLPVAQPLWQVSGGQWLLSAPWQILLPVLPLLAALAGSLPVLLPRLASLPLWAALLGLVVVSGLTAVQPAFTQYEPPAQPIATYGHHADLVLLEATIDESTAGTDGGKATLSVVWQPLQPLTFEYNLFFQALIADGAEGYDVIAQLDQQPLPDRPATSWQPGEILTATYSLDLPVDPNTANLRYYFGYYDWRDGTRLPLLGGDDKVILYGE